MKIDLRADLMSQDHTGYTWSLLEDAPDPGIIVPGALILAGEEGDPDDPVAVCRVVELEEINDHMVVRFEILPGNIEDYAVLVKRHNVNVRPRPAGQRAPSPLAAVADWGPAEDWEDWTDAAR